MRKHLSTIVLLFILFIGLSLLLYPTASDYWNSFHQTRAIATYAENVANLDNNQYDQLWEDARAYNQALPFRSNPYYLSEEQKAEYESLLDVSGLGVMGYIEIPEIDVSLPIYHGTEESVLQVAVGHLDWTSLPVGGESTHCVLSGHRGLPSAKLFTNLDKLREGDTFLLRVLDEVLTYEVDQILIVEPKETAALRVVEGKDYNRMASHEAGETSRQVIEQLCQTLPTESAAETEVPAIPEYLLDAGREMPVQTIEGKDYIGVLTIPSLELELPVISQWDYAALKVAPCRYSGSLYQDNLIICAHNFATHFGKLKNLRVGDIAIFTDMEENAVTFQMVERETLEPTDLEGMEAGDWDMTLYTCTVGGQSRVTVRFVREEP